MGEETVPAEQPAPSQEAWLPTPNVDPGRPSHSEFSAPEGSSAPVRVTWRVRDRPTFSALRKAAHVRRGPLVLSAVVGVSEARAQGDQDPQPPRVAYAIGRGVGCATKRNRIRRQLRAIVGDIGLTDGAYLIKVGPGASARSSAELRAWLGQAVGAVGAGARRG